MSNDTSSTSFNPAPDSGEADTRERMTILVRTARRAQNRGDTNGAFTAYASASELDPNDVVSWMGRSETAADPDERLISLAYASALDPRNRALSERLTERLAERIAQAHPDDGSRLFELGRELALVGMNSLALDVLSRATELDPTLGDAWLWRAGLTGDTADALESVRQAHEAAPGDPTVASALQWVQMLAGRGDSLPPASDSPAASTVSVPPAAGLNSADELIAAGELVLQAGDKVHALPYFMRATELDPRSERAWLWRASATDHIDEALTSLEQALAINPENTQAREARTFLRVRKLREGVKGRDESSPNAAVRSKPSALPPSEPFAAQRSAGTQTRVILLILLLVILGAVIVLWFLLPH